MYRPTLRHPPPWPDQFSHIETALARLRGGGHAFGGPGRGASGGGEFHLAIRENHEQMMLAGLATGPRHGRRRLTDFDDWSLWMMNGGHWWDARKPGHSARSWMAVLFGLPYCARVETRYGWVGLVELVLVRAETPVRRGDREIARLGPTSMRTEPGREFQYGQVTAPSRAPPTALSRASTRPHRTGRQPRAPARSSSSSIRGPTGTSRACCESSISRTANSWCVCTGTTTRARRVNPWR